MVLKRKVHTGFEICFYQCFLLMHVQWIEKDPVNPKCAIFCYVIGWQVLIKRTRDSIYLYSYSWSFFQFFSGQNLIFNIYIEQGYKIYKIMSSINCMICYLEYCKLQYNRRINVLILLFQLYEVRST